MNRRNAEPLDDQTTIDMGLVSQKSVDGWLKKFKQWDGTSKKSLLEKVLLLESFFARVFDPVHYTAFPELAEAATTCEDGGEDQPGCGAEFHADMPCCPFCTNSESEEPVRKSDEEIAEYLIRVEQAKVRAPAKLPSPPQSGEPRQRPVLELVKRTVAEIKQADPVVEQIAPMTNAPIATVEELDAAVQRAVSTYAAAATNAYECAVELREIHERQLWRQRRGDGEQPKYAHFNNFVEAELAPRGIDRKRAYGLIEMAGKFSRDEFNALGPAKMNVLVSMEEGKRRQLAQETIQKNLTLDEVRTRKAETRESSTAKPSPKPQASAKPSLKPTPESDRAFTMVFPSSSFSVDCVASKGDTKRQKIARSIDDLPVATVSGVNGMTLRIAVSQGKDGRVQVSGFLVRDK